MNERQDDPASHDAHRVVSAGDQGGSGVIGRDGALEPQWFDTRKAAEQFARARKRFFDGLEQAVDKAAAMAPGPRPGVSTGGWPASMIPASPIPVPPPPPGPWPSSMVGRVPTGPGPLPPPPLPPTPPGAWPMGMAPPPPPPPGPWPASMQPAPTPFGPAPAPGRGGFPSSMGGPVPTPPVAPPLPPGLKDMLRDLGKEILTASSHANGGKADWSRVGESIAHGMARAAPQAAAAAGLPVPSAATLKSMEGMAKVFADAARAAGHIRAASEAGGQSAEEINAGNRSLRGYNSQIAAAFGSLDYGDFRRNFERASATAGTTAQLAHAIDALRDARQPSEILKADLANRGGIFQASRATAQAKVSSLVPGLINDGLAAIDPTGKSMTVAGRAFAYLENGFYTGLAGWRMGGAPGALLGFVGGAGGTAAVDAWKGDPKAAPDPWGEFLKDANNARPLRPARPVRSF